MFFCGRSQGYQQKLEIEYAVTPSAMVYSCNKTTVAVYSIAAESKVIGVCHKRAIVFISSDKLQDLH